MPRRLAVYSLIPMLCCGAITSGNLFLNLFAFPNDADYSWVSDFIAKNVAEPGNSIFFKLSFVFSAKPVGDMLYMLFFSGTLLSFGGVCYELGRALFDSRRLLERLSSLTPIAVFSGWCFGSCILFLFVYLSKIGPRGDLPFYAPYIVPFTFAWLQLRRARLGAELTSRLIQAGHCVYLGVIVVWSGIVGPPKI